MVSSTCPNSLCFTVDGVTVGSACVVSDMSFGVGYAFTVRGAFVVDGMAMGAEVLVGSDAIVRGVMIVAVDDDVAQELVNLIGADCKSKYGSAPDNVVVDGQSYVPVLPPGS